jgi:ribonuclease HI
LECGDLSALFFRLPQRNYLATNANESSDLLPHSKMPNLKSVTIYCDGSSLGNGREETRAAAVALLGFRGLWRAFGAYLGKATNQQAEIAAAALGLEALKESCQVRLHTDSRYVVETMCGRFRRKANHEWWKRLDNAASRHEVEWRWEQGHAGHLVQEAADRAARKIAALGHVEPSVLQDAVDSVGVTEYDDESVSGPELF